MVAVWSHFSEHTGAPVDLDADPALEAKRLPQDIEATLYEIVKEALPNVAHGARARRVSVLLGGPTGGQGGLVCLRFRRVAGCRRIFRRATGVGQRPFARADQWVSVRRR